MALNDEDHWMPAWLALVRTYTRLWDQLEAGLRHEHGLSIARYDVLAHLEMAGGQVRLSELASSILLSPSGLSKLVDRMEASALLTRNPDPSDARSTFATITPRGRALAASARHSHHKLLRQTFGSALDDRDIADLTRITNRIAASTPNATPDVPARENRPGA